MRRGSGRSLLAGLAVVLWSGCAAPPAAAQSAAGDTFRDCDACPEMVVLPAGRFHMGSPPSERSRTRHEGPRRAIRIDAPFSAGKYQVTRAQFAAFARAAPAPATGAGCVVFDPDSGTLRRDEAARDWRRPGYAQQDDHPVVCVAWVEARAYVEWLSRETGRRYRLLSETEWEYAARAGSNTSRPWGDVPAQSCRHANLADESFARDVSRGPGRSWYPGWHACRDGFGFTSPVGRFEANRFGLHDMIGNAWEWVEDCWNDAHGSADAGAAPRLSGDCARRVYRGGAWRSYPEFGRSAQRQHGAAGMRHALIGFRVARSIENPQRPSEPRTRP